MRHTAEGEAEPGVWKPRGRSAAGAGDLQASTAAAATGTRPSPLTGRRSANPAGDLPRPTGDSGEPKAGPRPPEDARSASS